MITVFDHRMYFFKKIKIEEGKEGEGGGETFCCMQNQVLGLGDAE